MAVSNHLPSGSGWTRIMKCLGPAVLPSHQRESSDATAGTEMHQFLATVGTVGREAAVAACRPEWRGAVAAIDLDQYPQVDPASYAHEVAFAYDPMTGQARELHRKGDRDYSMARPGEIPVTVDVVGVTADGLHVVVVDWKNGHEPVPRPRRNGQLQVEALAAARAYRTPGAIASVGYVADDGPRFVTDRFDALDLSDIADRFRARAAAVVAARRDYAATGLVSVVAGAHCRYCDSFTECPEQWGLVRALAADPAKVAADVRRMLSDPAEAARAVVRLHQVQQVVKHIDEAVKAHAADNGGIDMGDGTKWGPVVSSQEKLDGDVTHAVVREVVHDILVQHRPAAEPGQVDEEAQAMADAAVSRHATKEGVKGVARELAARFGLKAAPINRRVLEVVAERGGVGHKTRTDWEFTPVAQASLPASSSARETEASAVPSEST